MRGGKVDRDNDRGAALYAAYLQGDASALEALVQLYGDALTRFAYCIVRDDALAEDVTADTFAALILRRRPCRLFRHDLPSFPPAGGHVSTSITAAGPKCKCPRKSPRNRRRTVCFLPRDGV